MSVTKHAKMSKKRRNITAQLKFETVMEGLRGEKPVAQICCERDITESLYYKWCDAVQKISFHYILAINYF